VIRRAGSCYRLSHRDTSNVQSGTRVDGLRDGRGVHTESVRLAKVYQSERELALGGALL